MRFSLMVKFTALVFVGSIQLHAQSANRTELADISLDPAKVKPLKISEDAPRLTLKDSQGNEVDMAKIYEKQPTVLVIFRGGWCPICTRHTNEFIKALPKIEAAGAKLIGISPDSIASSQANADKNSIPFLILSDSDVVAARAFGLAFQVDAQTVQRYQGFGIDLVKASGKNHNALPIPAVYIVDTDGKIVFAHNDPDYRQRLGVKTIIEQLCKL